MLTTDLLEFHAFCLTNTGARLQQYAAALNRVIKPGDTVLDLGAGLGVLGILSCRAGARRVHAGSGPVRDMPCLQGVLVGRAGLEPATDGL